jgi:hypothetical protein
MLLVIGIYMLCGFILGIVSSNIYRNSKKNTDGTLQVDVRNPEKDIYRLQLNSDLQDLSKKKKIILIVDPKAKLSN